MLIRKIRFPKIEHAVRHEHEVSLVTGCRHSLDLLTSVKQALVLYGVGLVMQCHCFLSAVLVLNCVVPLTAALAVLKA